MLETNAVDVSIVELLSGIARQFRERLRQASEGSGMKATPFQNEIIAYLGRNPGLGVMGLADLSGRDKAQVTRIIADLETLDLVSRKRSGSDRRASKLSLTEKGETIFRQVLMKRNNLATTMLDTLTPDERLTLENLLMKMRSGLAAGEHSR
ncbi:MarR family winged helix-turn-helix transcriptional regulator [Rhizobium panacihumi]|uniref:MarR family winged helix-turn-helix transcriptional regulator n=1 Tax=Rhizobium panacihumi TaxID=2008450 RepID=UPI003D7B01C2